MKRELESQLQNKYPKIFKDLYGSKMNTGMSWGIDCGDGWYWLIDNLCSSIQSYIDGNSIKPRIRNRFVRNTYLFLNKVNYNKITFRFPKIIRGFISTITRNLCDFIDQHFEYEDHESIPQVIATQIKEKFSGLRFYYYGGDLSIHSMVRMAEYLSTKICEYCGSIESVGCTQGWLLTICKDCYEKEVNKGSVVGKRVFMLNK